MATIYNVSNVLENTDGLATVAQTIGATAVKAGDIYPSAGADEWGIVLNDCAAYGVATIVTAGNVKTENCAIPNSKAHFKNINFYPMAYTAGDHMKLVGSAASVVVSTTGNTAVVYIDNDKFRDAATTTTNWTASQCTITAVTLSADKHYATITYTAGSTASKDCTVVPAAAACGLGVAPTTAIKIAATVSA